MDITSILTEFGLPITLSGILLWYVQHLTTTMINTLKESIEAGISDLKNIIIKLIDASKKENLTTAKLEGGLNKMVSIFTKIVKDINDDKKSN
tara:strand:+ start:3393 stop:3671 length:279 start_codon:yes stop_codon:yes gene_type:complete